MTEEHAAILLRKVRRLASRMADSFGCGYLRDDLAGAGMLRLVETEDEWIAGGDGYAMTRARFAIMDAIRKELGRRAGTVRIDYSESPPEIAVEDVQVDHFAVDRMRAAIAELPEQERITVVLTYYDGMTRAELMDFLSLSESRVSQIHTSAMEHLRERVAA